MSFKLVILTFTLGVLSLSSCKYHVESELFPEGCEVIDAPIYTDHIESIISRSCSTPDCHSPNGGGTGDFTSFENLQFSINDGSFQQEVLQDREMPPNEPLSECELELINKWIQQGAVQ